MSPPYLPACDSAPFSLTIACISRQQYRNRMPSPTASRVLVVSPQITKTQPLPPITRRYVRSRHTGGAKTNVQKTIPLQGFGTRPSTSASLSLSSHQTKHHSPSQNDCRDIRSSRNRHIHQITTPPPPPPSFYPRSPAPLLPRSELNRPPRAKHAAHSPP